MDSKLDSTQAEDNRQRSFFDLAENFRAATDPAELDRLGEAL